MKINLKLSQGLYANAYSITLIYFGQIKCMIILKKEFNIIPKQSYHIDTESSIKSI